MQPSVVLVFIDRFLLLKLTLLYRVLAFFLKKSARTVVHMMESVALPGGGGVRAAIKGYRVAIKTGTAKKSAQMESILMPTFLMQPVLHRQAVHALLVVIINEAKSGQILWGAVSAPVFGTIMGAVLRTMNVEPDALTPDDKK